MAKDKEQKEQLKKDILKALEVSLGVVTTACNKVGIGRTTFYKYCKEDENFSDAVKEIENASLDFAESKLFEKINGISVSTKKDENGDLIVYSVPPSDTAIIFFLKTKGKKRGYIEKQEIDHTSKGDKIEERTTIKFIKKS